MKVAISILIAAFLLLICASIIGVVGFRYPEVIQDEPLHHPQKVIRVQGTNLFLENGAILSVDPLEADGISNKLRQSAFQVDLEGTKGNVVAVWARQDGWVCGTPWAQPIRIPLFRDTTYKNRRELIAIGEYLESDGQQAGGANSH